MLYLCNVKIKKTRNPKKNKVMKTKEAKINTNEKINNGVKVVRNMNGFINKMKEPEILTKNLYKVKSARNPKKFPNQKDGLHEVANYLEFLGFKIAGFYDNYLHAFGCYENNLVEVRFIYDLSGKYVKRNLDIYLGNHKSNITLLRKIAQKINQENLKK
jgi:hypothetical protein